MDAMPFRLFNKENVPFIYEFSNKGSIARLKTLLAYTGIEHCFATGKEPDETGIWTRFAYNEKSRLKIFKYLPLPRKILDYLIALKLYIQGSKFLSMGYNIPRRLFDKFDVSVTHGLWQNEFFQKSGFIYYGWPFFVKNNKVQLDIFTREESYKVNKLIKEFNEKIDLYFIHLVDLDKVMHEYGVESLESKRKMKEQDKLIKEMATKFIERFGGNNKIVIWSDHGFLDVKGVVDVKNKIPGEITAFYDSTIARFWFRNDIEKRIVVGILKNIENGRVLSNEERLKYKIPMSRKYGDVLFISDPGYLILPNYHQGNKRIKGMHGYMPDKADTDGIFVSNIKLNKKVIEMRECKGIISSVS